MRLQRETVSTPAGDIRFLNDAYNANPDSMLASLRAFDELFPPRLGSRRVLILGDMYELGNATETSHREIGEAVRELKGIDLVICIGTHARHYAEQLRQSWTADRIMLIPELTPEAIRMIADTLRAHCRVRHRPPASRPSTQHFRNALPSSQQTSRLAGRPPRRLALRRAGSGAF